MRSTSADAGRTQARWRGYDRTLGMNGRNRLIERDNPAAAIRLVNDKHATKAALQAAGIPCAPTLALIRTGRELARFAWEGLPEQWALKPNQSAGGAGVLLSAERVAYGGWRSGSGRWFSVAEVREHVRRILDGEFSPRGNDAALFEPLIRSHPDLDRMSWQGLADLRVICLDDAPQSAMLRLPTRASHGRANLHQGALGAALDLRTGRVTRVWSGGATTTHHPDTGEPLLGAAVPGWDDVLRLASACAAATGLRYLGADVVVDRERGPLVLEVNARPGLQIQNVTGRGLRDVAKPSPAALIPRQRSADPTS